MLKGNMGTLRDNQQMPPFRCITQHSITFRTHLGPIIIVLFWYPLVLLMPHLILSILGFQNGFFAHPKAPFVRQLNLPQLLDVLVMVSGYYPQFNHVCPNSRIGMGTDLRVATGAKACIHFEDNAACLTELYAVYQTALTCVGQKARLIVSPTYRE